MPIATNKYYCHLPGQLSRWGVVDVGLRCPHSCVSCYYAYLPDGTSNPKKFAGMRKAPWKDTDLLLRQIERMAENGFLGFDITGGEPSIHPGIEEIIRHATNLGLSTRMITLGQFLGTRGLLEKLLDAGLSDILFSYHSADPETFNKLTGGTLSKMTDAMDRLGELGFQFGTNATCVAENYRTLPDLARSIITKNAYVSNLIIMNAYYGWSPDKASTVRAHYSDIAPYLREAIDILENDGGIAVNVRYAPLCTVAGLEKNLVGVVGVRYDPHEWTNTVVHVGPAGGATEGHWMDMKPGDPPLVYNSDTKCVVGRGSPSSLSKVFAPQCNSCAALHVCDGIDAGYLEHAGPQEFVPYGGASRGSALDKDRLAYLPAHAIKLGQKAPMREVVARLMGRQSMERHPLVSVIIHNDNGGEALRRCLESVVAQTWEKTEIIVVDNHSSDGSRAVLDSYGARITCLTPPSYSHDPAQTRNLGVAASSGEWLVCLDAGDYLEPSYIEEAIRFLRRTPSASILYSGARLLAEAGQELSAAPHDPVRLQRENYLPRTALYRRQIWDDVGGYAENSGAAYDWGLWLAAISRGYQAVALPRALVYLAERPCGQTHADYATLLRQVVQQVPEIFPHEILQQIKGGTVSTLLDDYISELQLRDGNNDIQGMINYMTRSPLPPSELQVVLRRLLQNIRPRPAFLLAKLLGGETSSEPSVLFALSLGGLVFGQQDDARNGLVALSAVWGNLAENRRQDLRQTLAGPMFDALSRMAPNLHAALQPLRQTLGIL